MRSFRAIWASLLLATACGNSLSSQPPRLDVGCQSDVDCGLEEVCSAGLCVRSTGGTFPIDPWYGKDGGAQPDGGVQLDGGAPTDGGAQPDGGLQADGGSLPDGGRADGGPVVDGGSSADGGTADGGRADGGAPLFCQPCSSDAECGHLKCVTTERTGERFCSPTCRSSGECPTDSTCSYFLVNQSSYCVPLSGTCVRGRCEVVGCPSQTPLCDSRSGRCYRTESRAPCEDCAYSYQCGNYWDRCVSVSGGPKRCAKDCDLSHGESCLSGYWCREFSSSGEGTLWQCVPLTNDCANCRADNPCPPGDVCDTPTGHCVSEAQTKPACSPCEHNADCGASTNTCYLGGCMPYCDLFTPCPGEGYRCTVISDEERHQSVRRCIPNVSRGANCEFLLFCAPCTEDEDCNGGVCLAVSGSGSKRCAPHCDATGVEYCPSGSTCAASPGGDLVCVPSACL
jgi:hypothetical protein